MGKMGEKGERMRKVALRTTYQLGIDQGTLCRYFQGL